MPEIVICDACDKTSSQVDIMIDAEKFFICDECVFVCWYIIEHRRAERAEQAADAASDYDPDPAGLHGFNDGGE